MCAFRPISGYLAAQSVYMSVYRRRWGAEFALQGARMRIARAYLVTG